MKLSSRLSHKQDNLSDRTAVNPDTVRADPNQHTLMDEAYYFIH